MKSVPEAKKELIKELVSLMDKYTIVGVVDMENMPTPQLQKMREQLRDKVVIKMSKKRLMKIALDEAKKKNKDIDALNNHMKGMPALLFTNDNPFKLFKTLQKNKSTTAAKPGQIAPKDILVKEGPTPFAPGPIIGELGALGIKAGIDGGKVAIKADKVVVKEGEVIDQKTASILSRLKIEPMEIGLDLVATYEDGTIFTKDILSVDEKEFIDKISQGAKWAFNLAIEIAHPSKETIEFMITKVYRESETLSVEQNILNEVSREKIIAKAEMQAKSVYAQVNK
ncbi:MAG: 50S ribosomal protein L10 [Candidatus Woesearchaeota archaeon]